MRLQIATYNIQIGEIPLTTMNALRCRLFGGPYPTGSMYGIFSYIYHKNPPECKYTRHGSYGYKPQPTPPVSTCLKPQNSPATSHSSVASSELAKRPGSTQGPAGFNRKALQWTLPGTITYPYPIQKACGKISFFSHWWDMLVSVEGNCFGATYESQASKYILNMSFHQGNLSTNGELVVWIPGKKLEYMV